MSVGVQVISHVLEPQREDIEYLNSAREATARSGGGFLASKADWVLDKLVSGLDKVSLGYFSAGLNFASGMHQRSLDQSKLNALSYYNICYPPQEKRWSDAFKILASVPKGNRDEDWYNSLAENRLMYAPYLYMREELVKYVESLPPYDFENQQEAWYTLSSRASQFKRMWGNEPSFLEMFRKWGDDIDAFSTDPRHIEVLADIAKVEDPLLN